MDGAGRKGLHKRHQALTKTAGWTLSSETERIFAQSRLLICALARLSEVYAGFVYCVMTGAREKNVHRLAERKGFRLDKVGKGQHRFYIVSLEF